MSFIKEKGKERSRAGGVIGLLDLSIGNGLIGRREKKLHRLERPG